MMIRHTLSCEKESSFRELWLAIFSEDSLTEKLAVAHSNVWAAVMGNFTLDQEGDITSWIQSIPLNDKAYSRLHFVFPYYIRDELNSLRYLGCGRRGFSSIPFSEIISIFYECVWFFIFLVMITVSASLKMWCISGLYLLMGNCAE